MLDTSEFRAFFALLLLPNRPRLDCRVSGLFFFFANMVLVFLNCWKVFVFEIESHIKVFCFLSSGPGGADDLWFHIGQFRFSVLRCPCPLSHSGPENSPLRPQISLLRPEIGPLMPQISLLRPENGPLRPQISLVRLEISPLSPKISLPINLILCLYIRC